jgi:hypothetical protein
MNKVSTPTSPPAFSATSPPSTGAVYRVYRELSASVVESSERESAVGEAPAERLPHNAAGRAELLRRVQEQGNPPLQDRFADSKAPVDKYRKTSDNASAMGLLYEYLKTELGVSESLVPELAADIHAFALKRVAGEVTGRAAPVAAPAPFAEALEAMTLKERRAALDQHYAAVKKNTWTKARGDEGATPEKFLAWLDVVFPDRREVGMVLSDLKYLDAPAYFKVMNWSDKNSKIEKTVIDSFGLPTKKIKYDPERDADAPKSLNEIVERITRGEGTFKNLHRSYARARYHAPTP